MAGSRPLVGKDGMLEGEVSGVSAGSTLYFDSNRYNNWI